MPEFKNFTHGQVVIDTADDAECVVLEERSVPGKVLIVPTMEPPQPRRLVPAEQVKKVSASGGSA